jgi:hypothetical protein
MVAESIIYDNSFFERVLAYPIYKTKNVVALTASLKELERENKKWVRVGSQTEEEEEPTINRVATNAIAMTFILNRLNHVLRFIQNKGQEIIETKNGQTSTDQLDFMSNHVENKHGFEEEFDRFHDLLDHFKEYILKPGSKTFAEIHVLLLITKPVSQEENIFVKHIHKFFPNAIDIKAEEMLGELKGTLTIDFNYRGNPFVIKIIPAKRIERDGEYYKIWADYHPEANNRIQFIAFTLPNNYVYVFDNDKTKFRDLSGSSLNDRTSLMGLSYLFHQDTLMNHKKVF